MVNIRSLLSNYFDILQDKKTSKYLECKKIPVSFDISEKTEDLWEKHNQAIKEIKIDDNEQKKSLFDLKIKLASRIFKNCCFCERRCGVDREKR